MLPLQATQFRQRSINENIRLIAGILRYTEIEKVPRLLVLLSIDFVKGF